MKKKRNNGFNRRRSDRLNPLSLKKVSPRTISQNRLSPRSDRPRSWWQRIKPFRRWRRGDFTWRRFLTLLAGVMAVLFIIIVATFAAYVRQIPNPKELTAREINQSTQIVDRNGKNLFSFYGNENRTLVTGDQISPFVKQATIATEDANFYNHPGFDIKGIARAVLVRLHLLTDHSGGGGSTITQQYIKNALLTRDQTTSRKIKELILAIEVEQRYSKDEILVGYLNQIPYGGSNYGIEAAAQTYFGKHASDLTLSEAATLAAIPQSPTYYSPYGSHQDALFARKDYVLSRMVKVGYITQQQADEAKAAAPNAENPSFNRTKDFAAQHFVFYVRQKLIDFMGGDPKTAEVRLDQAGYKVTTSLDLDVQNMAQQIMAEMGPTTVKNWQASNAAMTAVDPKTGEILAMVGSIDYEDSKSGNTNFANALLQPGSSFKPFVYATSFDPKHKYNPASITYDLPTDFGGGYKPNNYDGKFRGPTTDRNALAQSLNIPAVKNLYLSGIPDSIDTAHRLGISSLNDTQNYGLSLVLGAGEVRPVEMAGAFGGFANGGMFNALRPILKIEKDGKVIKDFTTTEATKAVEPDVAWQITSILSDNAARTPVFGAKNYLVLPDRPVAAKTGTTQSDRDAWTVGYTPQISVAVWVGNNEPNKTMRKGADGSVVAAPIWNRFMREYLKDKPVVPFPDPPSDMKQFTVDKLSGKIPTDQSPPGDHITEWMAPWQIPTDFDDVHITAKIDKVSGLLASDLTPPQNIETRTYFVVHSEAPDKPGWEIPVQDWARANGGGVLPPTQKSDLYSEGNRPTTNFVTPTNGASVNGQFTISVNPGGTRAITNVEFFVDNVSIGSVSAAPWQMDYNADNLSAGSHVISVTVTNDLSLTRNDQITVTKQQNDSTPPGPLTNFKKDNDGHKASNVPIRLSWVNPPDSDLRRIVIYITGTTNTTRTVFAPGTNIEISDLPVGTYTFTAHTLDANGNENSNAGGPITAQMFP